MAFLPDCHNIDHGQEWGKGRLVTEHLGWLKGGLQSYDETSELFRLLTVVNETPPTWDGNAFWGVL